MLAREMCTPLRSDNEEDNEEDTVKELGQYY